uniref:Uncharacterized protein n=1 Tax=Steinernema glaseri TaxID=37863 RepID=A0A1I8A417_9BILA
MIHIIVTPEQVVVCSPTRTRNSKILGRRRTYWMIFHLSQNGYVPNETRKLKILGRRRTYWAIFHMSQNGYVFASHC